MTNDRKRFWLVTFLIALGAGARLLPHPANFTPVAAIALLGGAYLEGALAYVLPLGMLALSDVFLGLHSTVAFVYTGFLIAAYLGRGLKDLGQAQVAGRALLSSLAFFAVSNFGVWAAAGLYPRTFAGLQTCYVAALPFLRNAALGDVLYACVLFGAVRLLAPQRRAVAAA